MYQVWYNAFVILKKKGKVMASIYTGFSKLDNFGGSITDRSFVGVLGYPAVGKTSFVFDIIKNNRKKKFLYVCDFFEVRNKRFLEISRLIKGDSKIIVVDEYYFDAVKFLEDLIAREEYYDFVVFDGLFRSDERYKVFSKIDEMEYRPTVIATIYNEKYIIEQKDYELSLGNTVDLAFFSKIFLIDYPAKRTSGKEFERLGVSDNEVIIHVFEKDGFNNQTCLFFDRESARFYE